MSLSDKCESLARALLFLNMAESGLEDSASRMGLQYRKLMSIINVRDAIKKGVKRANFKTELEISWVTFYLTKVFKEIR